MKVRVKMIGEERERYFDTLAEAASYMDGCIATEYYEVELDQQGDLATGAEEGMTNSATRLARTDIVRCAPAAT